MKQGEYSFIDLHCHILPGIDDGPPDFQKSMEMVKKAVQVGVEIIYCTSHIMPPHYNNSSKNINPLTKELSDMAVKAGYNIDLRPGGEVYYSDNMINQFKNGLIPEYSKGMILVEFPMNEIPRYAEKSFFELALAGAELILAHPERNQGISRDIKKAAMFVEKGIILLVNAGSITGSYGPQVQDCAFQLLDMGLVTAVASDSHRGRGFSKLPEARDIVVDKYGQNAGFKLFHYNPDMIIKGKPVYPFKKNAADDKKSTTANTTLKKSFLKSIFNFFR